MTSDPDLIAAPVISDWYRLPTADGTGWYVCDGWCQTEHRVDSLGRPRGIRPTPATPEQIAAVERAFRR